MAESAASVDKWWSSDTIAVVTGAGKGIGLEAVRALASQGITVVLTTRDEESGKKLVDQLDKQDGLKVFFHALDITNLESIEKFATWIKDEHNGLDILINNAGLMLHPSQHSLEEALPVIEVNYWGTKRLIEAMIPLMKDSSSGLRIVNMSTLGSRLDVLHNAWQQKLSDVENITEDMIEDFIKAYLEDVSKGEQFGKGWPEEFQRMDYCVAKMALNAYSRMLARDLSSRPDGRKIYVNCTSPGHTSCAMSGNTGHPPIMGANTAIWLALVPPSKASSGKYFVKKQDVGFFEIPLAHFDQLIYNVQDIKEHLHEHANYTRHKC